MLTLKSANEVVRDILLPLQRPCSLDDLCNNPFVKNKRADILLLLTSLIDLNVVQKVDRPFRRAQSGLILSNLFRPQNLLKKLNDQTSMNGHTFQHLRLDGPNLKPVPASDLVVVISRVSERFLLSGPNTELKKMGKEWLWIEYSNHSVQFGPFFNHEESAACFECFRVRELARTSDFKILSTLTAQANTLAQPSENYFKNSELLENIIFESLSSLIDTNSFGSLKNLVNIVNFKDFKTSKFKILQSPICANCFPNE